MNSNTTDDNPAREEVVLPNLAIVDPHIHLWNLTGFDYFAPQLIEDVRSGHKVEATVYVECSMRHSNDPRPAFRPVGETKYVLEQVKLAEGSGHDLAAGILGCADLMDGDAVRPVLEAHIEAGKGRFRGIRARGAWDAEPGVGYEPSTNYPQINVLREDAFLKGARCVADLGLVLDIWTFHTLLDDAATLAAKCPEVPIMIDHCGGPLGIGRFAGRRDEVFADWSAGIRKLSKLPNVHIKLSGLGISRMGFKFPGGQAQNSDELVAAWKPYIRTCLDAFGPERSVFASNFPVDRQASSYRLLINAYKKMLIDLSDSELQAVFAGNARRFYKI